MEKAGFGDLPASSQSSGTLHRFCARALEIVCLSVLAYAFAD